ncbi:MAG: TolC family protein [Legionella sp.]|uniref:TolC family protein n=1 Tax=Legionella sp. TaxID=459 RepID=UPI0028483FA0|nr:TolC family protein [Legionella sp.]
MGKRIAVLSLLFIFSKSWALDLIGAFEQALENDAVYQQKIIDTQMSGDDIAISLSNLLPNINFVTQPLINNLTSSGAIVSDNLQPANNVIGAMDVRLSATQTIFNLANFRKLAAAKLDSKVAAASLNAEYQNLIVRVVKAYFNVLYYEDSLAYYQSNKKFLSAQLAQVKEKYHLGKASSIDMAHVQSALNDAEIHCQEAQIKLFIHRQKLAEIIANDNERLAPLKNKVSLTSPKPENVNKWVEVAKLQNWNAVSNRLKIQSALEKIKEQSSHRLPVVNAEVLYEPQKFHIKNGSLLMAAGTSGQVNAAAFLNVSVPIYSGGLITATVKKYQRIGQQAKLEYLFSIRKLTYSVKKNYAMLMSDLNRIKKDKEIVALEEKQLRAAKEEYKLGRTDVLSVLNQEEKVIKARIRHKKDKYAYIQNLVALKQDAGTLSPDDLRIINKWLVMIPAA